MKEPIVTITQAEKRLRESRHVVLNGVQVAVSTVSCKDRMVTIELEIDGWEVNYVKNPPDEADEPF